MRVLLRLVGLLGLRPGRFALSVGLGALATVAGAVLVGLAGYLICRAARQPPILSLTSIMVAVRVAALTRPGARYAERLTSTTWPSGPSATCGRGCWHASSRWPRPGWRPTGTASC